ncbi:hypothetical protein Mal4_04020 [Maioricimonas rarisocia]|uniref:DUF502 domain-containing protein n=1 Tax=Maioricimonas rarisocia TaxID=2528026 RepID=A0A517Z117_9PLAN|nr:hypothetical protein [Maioricimonas rarisocia]QDU36119.1 hypothetical protein Mal4_04020 [Maioricimonas rarisocia]
MKQKVTESIGFLKTTAIGGLIFLLPLVVIGALLGYLYSIVLVVYEPLKEWIPVGSTSGLAILFLMAVGIVVALCFMCGLAARRAIGRRFSRLVEKNLVMLFPKYAIYKDIVAGNIGGEAARPTLFPVTVQFDDVIRIGYRAGRTDAGLVIVYLPGAPDPWIGSVVLVEESRVQSLPVDFNNTAAICERLGRDSEALLAGVTWTRGT